MEDRREDIEHVAPFVEYRYLKYLLPSVRYIARGTPEYGPFVKVLNECVGPVLAPVMGHELLEKYEVFGIVNKFTHSDYIYRQYEKEFTISFGIALRKSGETSCMLSKCTIWKPIDVENDYVELYLLTLFSYVGIKSAYLPEKGKSVPAKVWKERPPTKWDAVAVGDDVAIYDHSLKESTVYDRISEGLPDELVTGSCVNNKISKRTIQWVSYHDETGGD